MGHAETNRVRRVRTVIIATALLAPGLAAFAPSASAAPSSSGPITKLAVYMLENTSQAAAYAGMPYLSSLAGSYGKATAYTGVTHPSEGNYVTIVSGQGAATCGIADPYPGQCPQPGPTVFGQAIGAGRSAKLYQDGMDANCSASGDYGHNPWLHFASEASLCAQFDQPMGTTSGGNLAADIAAGTLPNLSMIVPSDANNAHDGTLATADAYLQGWMTKILAGPDWNSGHLGVVITFDEGETTEDVAFVVVSPTVAPGTVVATKADHNSLERLYATVGGVAPINGGTTATDLAAPFNISGGSVPPPSSSTTTTTTTTARSSSTTTTVTTAPPTGPPAPGSPTTLHYTANEDGSYAAPASVGFNVHDTGPDRATIDALPNNGKALVWLGEKCPSGLSGSFTAAVNALGGDARVFGYYLSDEPDPASCPQGPANVAAETDYIHAHASGQRSFVVVDDTPGAWAAYAPAHSHLDLVGLDPYPCRTDTSGCDLSMIDSAVARAEAAGIAQGIIVPTFQTFGGASAWVMPTPTQLQSILAEWAKVVPAPVLDYSYSWGCQGGSLSDCLQNHPEAQAVIQAHNASSGPPPSPPTTAPPTTAPPTTAPPTTAPPTTAPPTTAPPTTAPPTTAPPTTDPPTTAPPGTDPPTTAPPGTDPPTTAPPTTERATTPPATPPTTEDRRPTERPTTTTTGVEGSKRSRKHGKSTRVKHTQAGHHRSRHLHRGTQDAAWLETNKLRAYFQGDWAEAMAALRRPTA